MSWLRIDDGFNENPKIEGLRDRAFRIHIAGLVYCAKNLTDGYLSEKSVKVLAVLVAFPVKRHVVELVDARLWQPDDAAGYWINDYLTYNPSSDEVKAARDRNADRQKKHRESRVTSRVTDGVSNGVSNAAPAQPSPARPVKELKAVPADQEIEHEIDKILRHVKGADDGTRGVLVAIARKLPVGCVAKVRESCQSRSVSVGYAVNALKSELADLEEVA